VKSECAFGEIIRRWGILWRPFEMDFAKCAHVIARCIRLYNLCIDRHLEVEVYLTQPEGDIEVQPRILESSST